MTSKQQTIIFDLPSHLISLIFSFIPELRATRIQVCTHWLGILPANKEEIVFNPPLKSKRPFHYELYISRSLLRFSCCSIHLNAKWNSAIIPGLIRALRMGLKSIVMLDLTGVRLDQEATADLVPLLCTCSGLKTLNLQHTAVDASFSTALQSALPCWPLLSSLNLSGAITAMNGDLTRLLLSWPLDADSHCCNPMLTSLSLSWLPLGGHVLATVLAHLPALQHIDFSACLIDSDGGPLLAAALPACPSLRSLRLDGNPLGPAAAEAVAAAAAAGCPGLEELSLCGCGLRDAGAAAVAAHAARLPALTALNVARNNLTPLAIAGVAAALGSPETERTAAGDGPTNRPSGRQRRVDARGNIRRRAGEGTAAAAPPPGPGGVIVIM